MKLRNMFFYLLLFVSSNSIYTQIDSSCVCPLGINPVCDLICSTGCFTCGATTYVPRSQGDNTVRELVGWSYYLHAPDYQDCYKGYSVIAATFEFTRSFKSEKIASALFCTDCLIFSGSQFPTRTNTDIIADNFGLSPLFHRALKIEPVIENFILDISFYANLSDLFPGFWIQIFAPVTHTKWDLGLSECLPCAVKPTVTGTMASGFSTANCNQLNAFPANYMTVGSNGTCALESLRQGLAGQTFADMTIPWKFGKWSFCPLEKNGVADLNVQVGLNFFESILYHFGVFIKAVAPTGNKPKAEFLFEPIVGNRGHWELGGGITTHTLLWTSPYDDQAAFGIYFKGNATHVFKSNEIRIFDFTNNGLLSRYLLLKELAISNQDIAGITLNTANYITDEPLPATQRSRLINAINFNTRNAEVWIDAKGEATLMFSYVSQGLGFDFGYNIYGRTKENLCIKTKCPCYIDELLLGIKGTEGVGTTVFGFDTDGTIIADDGSVGLNSTQSQATIFTPTTVETVDNPRPLLNPTTSQLALAYNSLDPVIGETSRFNPGLIIANASLPPVLISCTDLNPNSAATCAQLSHKLFINFSYRWLDTDWFPHINLGAEVEFNSNDNNINECRNAINQWGIWLKGGFTF